MTREEAITLIKSALKTMDLPIFKEYVSDLGYVLEIAIKALEREAVCDRLAREYISTVKCCDECFASTFCTINGLRESREPKDYCIENIKKYFESKSEG